MSTITADPVVEASLSRITQPAVLQDGQGRLLGYYVPATSPDAGLYARAAAAFDVNEMKRRMASGERGFTTAEVIAFAESQEKP